METLINTEIYNALGERWYTADDDPVALLRSESRAIAPWVLEKIQAQFQNERVRVLDVGCGAGFLSNRLAQENYQVDGIDLSVESLAVAHQYDLTKSVRYQVGNAMQLPYPDQSFEVVTAMDFLEHVDDPAGLIKEVGRVLKPQGLFLFHTFNRNFLSRIVIIKLVEWFVRNTPKHLHLYEMFITPDELKQYCRSSGLTPKEFVGLEPKLSTLRLKNLINGTIPKTFEFGITSSLKLSYMGFAEKN